MVIVVQITGTAQKEAWDLHVLPPVEKVAPGVWSIPVPIPNNPLRYVLVYLLELDDGVALIDSGWDTADAWSALQAGLAEAGGSLSDVASVLITHIHPDHYGLAGRIRQESGATIALHPADAAILQARYADTSGLLEKMLELLQYSGVPESSQPELNLASMAIISQVSMAAPDILLEHGDRPNLAGWDLEVIWTPGHSPGHLCFYSESRKLLFSGDHVLPRITPNVAVHTQQQSNPLGDYLQALLHLAYLNVDEVLPGHEYRFADLLERVNEIIAHHSGRLAEIEQVIQNKPGITAWETTLSLTWSRPWDTIPSFMQRAANGETLAHLVILENHNHIRHEGTRPAHFYPVEQPDKSER